MLILLYMVVHMVVTLLGSSVKRLQNTLVVHYYISLLCLSCNLIAIFSTAFGYVTPVTLSNKLLQRKKCPWRGPN